MPAAQPKGDRGMSGVMEGDERAIDEVTPHVRRVPRRRFARFQEPAACQIGLCHVSLSGFEVAGVAEGAVPWDTARSRAHGSNSPPYEAHVIPSLTPDR